ncbi:hypothetical protein ACFVTC_02580 [Streptomyces sp. NPDC057950]|uniref:hypothetical protein n=1 Tax=Streptomyces sp. NPDC057950 TaxID=3346288 RepID=UPI0036E4F665
MGGKADPSAGDSSALRALDTGGPGRRSQGIPDEVRLLRQELVSLGPDLLLEPAHGETPGFEDFAVAVLNAASTEELDDG